MTLLAPRNGNDSSYVMRIKDAIHFACQAQYLVRLKGDLLAPRIGNDVSYVMQITDDMDSVWQAR